MKTVLSGVSGAFYYKPAGTVGTFSPSNISTASDEITLDPYLGFELNDPVKFSIYAPNSETPTGTLPSGISAGTTYYVIQYTKNTGVLKVSLVENGSSIDITTTGSVSSPVRFKVEYADYAAVAEVQSWTFQYSRAELDVTKIGQPSNRYVPIRSYIPGFADGNGTARVYLTDEEKALSSRIVNDVLKRRQTGASVRLYIDKVVEGGVISSTLSRSITLDAILTSADLKANTEEAAIISVNFRPSSTVELDLPQTAEEIITDDYWSNMATQLYGWQELAYIGWWGN